MTTKELADHYGIKYVSLQEYGVYSVAFLPDEALRMVNILREEVTPILGGDVYVKKIALQESTPQMTGGITRGSAKN